MHSKALFHLRTVIAALPLGYAMISRRWECEAEWVILPGTALCILMGLAIRGWASTHCGYGSRGERRLTRTGPYAIVRNPLYIGNLLVLAGLTFASELVWLVPITLLWGWGVYSLVITTYEEPRLVRWYGEDYRRYRRSVPAWIPSSACPAISLSGRALVREAPRLLFLAPFILKEMKWPGLS